MRSSGLVFGLSALVLAALAGPALADDSNPAVGKWKSDGLNDCPAEIEFTADKLVMGANSMPVQYKVSGTDVTVTAASEDKPLQIAVASDGKSMVTTDEGSSTKQQCKFSRE